MSDASPAALGTDIARTISSDCANATSLATQTVWAQPDDSDVRMGLLLFETTTNRIYVTQAHNKALQRIQASSKA